MVGAEAVAGRTALLIDRESRVSGVLVPWLAHWGLKAATAESMEAAEQAMRQCSSSSSSDGDGDSVAGSAAGQALALVVQSASRSVQGDMEALGRVFAQWSTTARPCVVAQLTPHQVRLGAGWLQLQLWLAVLVLSSVVWQSMMATRQLLKETGVDCLVQPVSPAAMLECLCKCIEGGVARQAAEASAASPDVAAARPSHRRQPSEAAFVSSSQSAARNARVLLVDDSALNVRVRCCCCGCGCGCGCGLGGWLR